MTARWPAALGAALVVCAIAINEWTIAAVMRPDGARITNPAVRILIAAFELGLAVAGVALIRWRHRIRARDLAFSLVPLLLVFAVTEVVMRAFVFRGGFANTMQVVDALGWAPRANIKRAIPTPYEGMVPYTAAAHGFRRFGALDIRRPRILVIGDSFTQAYNVPDGNAYFDHLARALPHVEFFVFGALGYGTLQEYMILDRYLDRIRPDLILWQFTSNDLVNNDPELERLTLANGNGMWRPFYVNGRIEVRYPSRAGWLVGRSYVLRYLHVNLKLLRALRFDQVSLEYRAFPDHPLYRRAVRTTSTIVGLAAKRAGGARIVMFSVDAPEWVGDAFASVAAEHKIPYIAEVPVAIAKAKAAGVRVDNLPDDGHWTSAGHAVAAHTILEFLGRRRLLPTSDTPRPAEVAASRAGTPTGQAPDAAASP
jgi:hypothetical protein